MNTINTIKVHFFKGAAFAAGLTVFVSLSWLAAQTLNSFNPGDVVSSTKINENFLIAAPTGQVSAFYLGACPDGWEPADGTNGTPDLRGRFIRGLDDAGTGAAGMDPDGVRLLGNEQADAFQGHRHNRRIDGIAEIATFPGLLMSWNAGSGGFISASSSSETFIGDPVTDTVSGTPRVAIETRPRNVALIYCMRKDT